MAPGIHGPSLRWYRPSGMLALALRSAWRYFVTGRELWGRGDNATFLHDATVDHRKRPYERLTRARWRRVAWRWALLGVPWALADGWAVRAAGYGPAWPWPWLLAGYYATALAGAAAYGGRALARWWPARHVRREYAYPVWQVVTRILGERYTRRAAVQAVQLPPGFGLERPDVDEDAPELSVRIHLPAVPLDEGMKSRIVRSAGERLGMPDASAAWMVKGAHAYVDLSPKVFPPRALAFAEVRGLFLDASPVRPLVGLAAGRRPVYADLDNDGPHIGISGGTGTGKSTLLRIILAKRVAAGAGLVVCDYKVTSHPWARKIAQDDPHRALYVTDEDEIHETIMAVFGEFQRRRNLLKTDPDALDTFRDVDLLVEELNSLADMLRKWWGHERRRIIQEAKDLDEPVPYVPAVCPSVDALAGLVQMSRELRIRVHFAAQRLDASALSPRGGGAVRESITNRFLAKYTRQAWAMLCGGVPFEAFPGGPRGIWTAVVNAEVTHFRVPLLSNAEAYALAMGGEPPAGPVLGGRAVAAPQRRRVVQGVTLRDAAPRLPGKPSLDALRKAVQRGRVQPIGKRGNADVFDLADLEALYALS